ncbi:MAG: hypothetical protein KFH98_12010 [Gemmatimonadetes bacterium]|nr:hypothetical protein [Gemmatimonadota bacterium]
MRKILTFAMLFACATAVQAQEAPREAGEAVPVEATTVESAATAEAVPAETPVPTVDLNPRNTTAGAIDAATLRAPADFDEAAQDVTTPRNFWWLVGAIVLGGIILALVL